MPKYRVMVEGRNFLLNFDGKRRKHGFYQTVFVESADSSMAEADALAQVRANNDLKEVTLNSVEDPPVLYADSVGEVKGTLELPRSPEGRSYYPERKWWQFWR